MNIFYIPFIFYYCQQVLIRLRVSSLLSPLNDDSVDIADDENSCQFSAKAEFISLSDTEADSPFFPQMLQC